MLEINRIHFPVGALGPGRRLVIWVQGCPLACSGCVSADTWPVEPGRAILADQLLEQIEPWLAEAEGLTLTGGEPLAQPDGVLGLLERLSSWRGGRDVLLYTGYRLNELCEKQRRVLAQVDAVMTGRYDSRRSQHLGLRGSDNQTLLLLTDLALKVYGAPQSERTPGRLNMIDDGKDLWLAGIPRREDLAQLSRLLHKRGYQVQTTSQNKVPAQLPPIRA